MRRTDDVYFFTLIDFLVQVFFFGLLLYLLAQAQSAELVKKQVEKTEKVDTVLRWTGFSRLTELTDFLSELAPPNNFQGWADFISHTDKTPTQIKDMKDAHTFVKKNGGEETIQAKLDKYDKAYGLPPCSTKLNEVQRPPVPVALFRVDDEHISLITAMPDFQEVLGLLSKAETQVNQLPLAEFRRVFGELRKIKPMCNYFVEVQVRTKFLAPMDTLQAAFRILGRK